MSAIIYGVDWAHKKDEKERVFDGTKVLKGMPKVERDMIIVTENMPDKDAKKYFEKGVRIFRTNTHETKKYRDKLGLPKDFDNPSDEEDARILWQLYQENPDIFYEWYWNPDFQELKFAHATWKEIQNARVAMSNRSWAAPDAELIARQKAHFIQQEKELVKDLRAILNKFPIWTEFLKDIDGIEVPSAASLIAYYGDPRRFPTLGQARAYFGLDVRDGKAPKRKSGEQANWHQDGRALIVGVISCVFIRNKACEVEIKRGPNAGKKYQKKGCHYRAVYEQFKAQEVAKNEAREKSKQLTPKHVDNRARRLLAKAFFADFYYKYRELAGLEPNQEVA